MSTGVGSSASSLASPSRARTWPRLLGAAIVVGLGANQLMRAHLGILQRLAATDPLAARATLAAEVRYGGLAVFATVCALGASLVALSLRSMRDERFPPTGVFGFGATRILTGSTARRAARVGLVLAVALIACSIAGAWLSCEMAARLLACRAGVPPAVP